MKYINYGITVAQCAVALPVEVEPLIKHTLGPANFDVVFLL